jgi:hypothetical protein
MDEGMDESINSRPFGVTAYVEASPDIEPGLLEVLGTYPEIEIEYPFPEDFENGKDGAYL